LPTQPPCCSADKMDLTEYYKQRSNKEKWAIQQVKWLINELGDDDTGRFTIESSQMNYEWYKHSKDYLISMLFSSGIWAQVNAYRRPERRTRLVITMNRMSEEEREAVGSGWESDEEDEEGDDFDGDATQPINLPPPFPMKLPTALPEFAFMSKIKKDTDEQLSKREIALRERRQYITNQRLPRLFEDELWESVEGMLTDIREKIEAIEAEQKRRKE